MKFNSAFKYQISGMKRPLIIFYIIIYALLAISILQRLIWTNSNITISGSGLEVSSMIFLFVCGLNSFKSTFNMFLVNGVSRRTMFKSYAAMIAPIAAGMALIDSLNSLLMASLVNYSSFFHQMYHARYGTGLSVQTIAEGFLWMFAIYMVFAMLGFFITTIYYRMKKPVKLLVSIGVPVFFFMVLPYADAAIFNGGIYRAIGRFFAKAGGFLDGHNPYIAVLSSLIALVLLGALSFLAMRRATVKE